MLFSRKIWFALIFFSVAMLLAGCGVLNGGINSTDVPGIQIDPVFRNFYNSIDQGRGILGPAIYPAFGADQDMDGDGSPDGIIYQYLEAFLMVYNPNETEDARFKLYPLGPALGLSQKSVPGDLTPGEYVIYDDFLDFYNPLSYYAGKPISDVVFNYEQNRIEQYFENLGLYMRPDDPKKNVYFLAYGAMACHQSDKCTYQAKPENAIIEQMHDVEQPFIVQVARLNGISSFGRIISKPFTASDGMYEQVHENIAVFMDPNDPTHRLQVRPIAEILEMPHTEPGVRLYSDAQGMVFYAVDGNGEYGYHVPKDMDAFIAQHGGREISGDPRCEVYPIGNDQYQQCFQNYCLIFDARASGELKVRMAPLGADYLEKIKVDPSLIVKSTFSPEEVLLNIAETKPKISTQDQQVIDISLRNLTTQRGFQNVSGVLNVFLPDGSVQEFDLSRTDSEGRTVFTMPVLGNLPNSAVVNYQVCMNLPMDDNQPICAFEGYLIWENN